MNQRIIAIGAAAVALVLLLWYFFLWSPQGRRIDDARDRREAAEALESELSVRLNRLREQKRNEASLRSQVELLRVAIPDQPNLAQFILDANDAATRSGIDFLSVSPTPPAPPTTPVAGAAAPPAEIRLALSITGGYFQVIDYVNRLNDLPRLVVIDNFSVTAGGQQAQLSVQLAARMFVSSLPAGANAPAPGAAAPPTGATTTSTTAPGATTTTVAGATTTPTTATTVAP